MDFPRHDLIRMVCDIPELRADGGDGNTMVGYPIVFNQWARIRSWEGDFMERVAPGATKKSIRENPPKVLFNHGFDPQIGDKPLGVPKVLREDDTGLWAETPLANTSYNADIRELINIGAIDGQSFRFSVVQESWNKAPKKSAYNPLALPERTIQEIRMPEFGPVTMPAYKATTIGMRSRAEFALWQQLPEDKRAELFQLLGLGTSLEAGEATSEREAAAEANGVEPAVPTTRHVANRMRWEIAQRHVKEWCA